MQTDARYTLIGAFFLIVVSMGTFFLFWAARWDSSVERQAYDVIFQGSVSGLSTGSQVLFNGIRVGEVTNLRIDPQNPGNVVARINVEAITPIKQDTAVTLEYQGLTGVASVSMEGGSSILPYVRDVVEDEVPVLTARRSTVQDFLESAREIMTTVQDATTRIDAFLAENEAVLSRTLRNFETFSDGLAQSSDSIGTLTEDASRAARNIAEFSDTMNRVVSTNEDAINQIVRDAQAVTSELAAQRESFGEIIANANSAVDDIRQMARSANELVTDNAESVGTTIANIERFTTTLAESDESIARTIANLERISTTLADKETEIASSIDNIERITSTIAGKDEDIERFITEAANVAESLVSLTQKAEVVLGSIDNAFQGDSANFFENASAAAESFRRLTENLEARTDVIANDISRFTGRGLRDLEALIGEARSAVGALERTMNAVERNPQRFIFGGDEVRQYSPR